MNHKKEGVVEDPDFKKELDAHIAQVTRDIRGFEENTKAVTYKNNNEGKQETIPEREDFLGG